MLVDNFKKLLQDKYGINDNAELLIHFTHAEDIVLINSIKYEVQKTIEELNNELLK